MTTRLVLLLAALAAAPAVRAQGVDPEPFRFGLVGLARLQTARLNLVNHPPDPGLPADPCRVGLGFVDTGSNPFRSAAGLPIAAQYDLAAGASVSLDLPSADAFRGLTGLRVPIRATASAEPLPGAPVEACARVVPTLEIFDPVTGRTQVALYPYSHPPDPIAPDSTNP
jgi:hypothetical protein